VLRALARDVDTRWQSAAEMRAALGQLLRYHRAGATPRAVAEWSATTLDIGGASRADTPRVYTDADDMLRLTTEDIDEEAPIGDDPTTRVRNVRAVDDPSKEIQIESPVRGATTPGVAPPKRR
jgi:hypothetical protein